MSEQTVNVGTEDLTEEESAELEASKAPPVEDDSDDEELQTADEGEEEPKAAEPEKPEKKFVPLQALDSERGKRREVEEQLAAMQRELIAMKTGKPAEPEKDASEEMPDPVMDPEGFKAWFRAEKQKITEPYQKTQAQQQQYAQHQQQLQQLSNYARQHESAFRNEYKDADYDGALQFMREREARKFEIMGFSPEDARQRVFQSEIAVTAQAAQMGQNPAALIYNLALENGFTPKQAAQAVQDAGEKITRLADAQQRTRSTAHVGGSPKPDEYSLRDLANMSPEKLAALEKKDPEKFRKMIGG